MNTTFLTWLVVAAVVGGALLLLLGMPTGEQASPLVLETVSTESAQVIEETYWEPATPVSRTPMPVQYVETRSQPVQPCGSCGASQPAPVVPARVTQPNVAYCAQRVPTPPCGTAPCSGIATYCGTPCGSMCPLDKPGINRNMELCLDECTFVQLHTTIPHPICADVRFEWTTSKGSFLDPTASNPVYYVPTTQFPGGEDVWIVVTITDGAGAKYTDQIKLHVVNIR
ncbi:hypothetical protein KAR02_05100 [Candidatus Bipolaricaulota bacterium]|nr:hypothetical protein [Candidatus Bipolaricaulota bacterium]